MFKEGAIKSPLDVRDIQLAQVQASVVIPDEYIPDVSEMFKLFQNGFGVCSAHAGAHFKQIQEHLELNKWEKFSPRYLWIKTKQIDGVPIEAGSYLRAIFKSLLEVGICDYQMLPNDFSVTLREYSNLALITSEMDNNANPRIIKFYAFLDDLSFEGLKQAIYQNKAVLMRIMMDEGFFKTITPTFTQKKWGHLIVAFGYDKNNIYIVDSTEGDLNFAIKRIREQYIPFITEAGTAIDADTKMIRNLIKQRELLQKLVALYQKLISFFKKR